MVRQRGRGFRWWTQPTVKPLLVPEPAKVTIRWPIEDARLMNNVNGRLSHASTCTICFIDDEGAQSANFDGEETNASAI
jgi:hypothetical protein